MRQRKILSNYLQVMQFVAPFSILKLKVYCRVKAFLFLFFFNLEYVLLEFNDLWEEKYYFQINI